MSVVNTLYNLYMADDYISKLRKAKKANDPLLFLRTRFITVGNNLIPYSGDSPNDISERIRDFMPSEYVSDPTIFQNGSYKTTIDVHGLGSSCIVLEKDPADAPCDFYRGPISSYVDESGSHRFEGSLYWAATAYESGLQTYYIQFWTNLPVFNKYTDESTFNMYVIEYWNTGSEEVLMQLKQFLSMNWDRSHYRKRK